MYPEDRVLVGVISTQRDLRFAQDAHWYRIPQKQMPRGVHAEYLAFFLSGRVFRERSGTIAYFARRSGLELVRRRDLLGKVDHPRANDVYYKVNLNLLNAKEPPVTNPTQRRVAFIHTTWDRFVHARQIADLYSDADRFVDRVYHVLRSRMPDLYVERYWDAEHSYTGFVPQLRILCQDGTVSASMNGDDDDNVYLDASAGDDEIFNRIKRKIDAHQGPYLIHLPVTS